MATKFEIPDFVKARQTSPAPLPAVEIILISDWPAYRALHPELEFTGKFDIQGRAIFSVSNPTPARLDGEERA